ncbi:MAG: DUF5689 domain-containing protein [Rikenellaceae bacterium]
MGRLTQQLLILVALSAAISSCYDSFDDSALNSQDQTTDLVANTTIESLHSTLVSERFDIMDDVIVEGVVTANDESGNIYKSFFMESDGYALEVLEGQYDLHVARPVGQRVVLKLEGLSLARYNSVVRVGLKAPDYSYYTLDYLEVQALIDLHIFNCGSTTEVEARSVSIGELTADMCGSLVEIEGLIHTPAVDDTQPYLWEGYECFEADGGARIWCNTSSYANFASVTIPSERVLIRGILKQESGIPSVSGEQYIVVMRDVEDCIIL